MRKRGAKFFAKCCHVAAACQFSANLFYSKTLNVSIIQKRIDCQLNA